MKAIPKQQKILVALLLFAIAAYLITLPIRERLALQVKQINAEIAKKRAAQAQQTADNDLLTSAANTARQNPGNSAAQAAYANQLQQNGSYALAERYWRNAVKLQPNSAELLADLGDCLTLEKREDLAIDAYKMALVRNPNNLHALTRLSVRYVALGWNQEAANLLDAAVKRNSQSAPLYVARAMVNEQASQFSKAESDFKTAYKLNPQDTAIIPLLVDVYRKAGQFAKASVVINEYLPTFSPPAALYIEGAQVAMAQHNPSLALQQCNSALASSPGNIVALALRGEAERALNKTPEAERDFREVYKLDPGYNQITLMLGQILIAQRKTTEAKPLLVQAAEQQKQNELEARLTLDVRNRPSDPAAHLAAAQMYLQTGQTARAVVEFKKTLKLKPGLTAAMVGLKSALGQLGAAAKLTIPGR